MLCNNIEEAWRMCDQEAERDEDMHLPFYDDCTAAVEEADSANADNV